MTLHRPCKDLVIPCLPSHLEASEGHRKRKGEEATTLIFVRVFIGFALSGLSWSSLGAFLGPSWGSSGESGRSIGAILEAIDQNRVWHLLVSPRRGPKSRLLGLTWAALGALLGALGPFFGSSWASLGALLGHLGAILRPQKPIGSEKERKRKTLFFLMFLKDVGLSGTSFGSKVKYWCGSE